MRILLPVLLAFPLTAQQPAVSRFAEAKAVALLRGQLPCLGCHELNGDGGRSAPSLSTVAARRNAAYIRAIVQDPQSVVPGAGMPRTPMPAATRETIIRYLARDAAPGPAPTPQALAKYGRDLPASGLYNRWCASCHGHNGSGDGPNAAHLPVKPAVHSDPEKMGSLSDDTMFDAIAGGGIVMGKSARMPAFGETLTPAEIRTLVAYIREKCSCSGPLWSRDRRPR
jgi:mono/diheme cytochrome c family protein